MTRRLGSLSFALGQMALSLLLPLAALAQRTSGPPPRPRIGLALEGGGALGLAQQKEHDAGDDGEEKNAGRYDGPTVPGFVLARSHRV